MIDYNAQLHELQQQIVRKSHLEKLIEELKQQREELNTKVCGLRREKQSEQGDVDRLEGRSLAAFFYAVIGKKVEKLDKEREEAYAAAVKCDAAERELEAVNADISKYETEYKQIRNCNVRYNILLKEKKEAIKNSDSPIQAEIQAIEEEIALAEGQKNELEEALLEAERALNIAYDIQSMLDRAEGLGTWDLFGGGMLTTLAKHDTLDEAQAMVEELQIQLRRLKTELTDVSVSAEVNIKIDSFTRFADYFFDGFFADVAVLNRIGESQNELSDVIATLKRIVKDLTSMLSDTKRVLELKEKALNRLVVSA